MTHLRILLAFVATLLLAVPALAAPAFTLSRTAGPPTGGVTVNGTGFPARQLVDIFFDTGDECVVATSSTGKFSCKVKVPARAQPGTHFFTVSLRSSGFALQKSFTVRTDWTQNRGLNAAQAGYNFLENTISPATVASLDRAWRVALPAAQLGSMAVSEGKIFALTVDGKINAFNAATGAAVAGFPRVLAGATFTGGAAALNSLAIGSGNVYACAGGATPRLFAFSAKTGAAVAGFPVTLPGDCTNPVTVAGGKVFLGVGNQILAFSATTGAPAGAPFPITQAGAIIGAPTIAQGDITTIFSPKNIAINDLATGVLKLTTGLGGTSVNVPALYSNGALYVATDTGSLITSFKLTNGVVVSNLAPGPLPVGLAAARSTIFATTGGGDHRAYALEAGNLNTELWSNNINFTVVSPPVVAGGVVFYAGGARLLALDAADGRTLWSTRAEPKPGIPMTVANGMLYVGITGNFIAAYKLTDIALGPNKVARPLPASLKPDYRLKPVRQ